MDYLITHVVPDSHDPDRRADAIYGPDCGLVDEAAAIQQIDLHLNRFHTVAGGRRVEVVAVSNIFGTRYLTTARDGVGPNDLCQLPRYHA